MIMTFASLASRSGLSNSTEAGSTPSVINLQAVNMAAPKKRGGFAAGLGHILKSKDKQERHSNVQNTYTQITAGRTTLSDQSAQNNHAAPKQAKHVRVKQCARAQSSTKAGSAPSAVNGHTTMNSTPAGQM